MTKTTHNDLVTVHKYLDEVTNFIQAIIQDENASIVLACQVFQDHKQKEVVTPFPDEEKRLLWLRLHARNLALYHIKAQSLGKEKQDEEYSPF